MTMTLIERICAAEAGSRELDWQGMTVATWETWRCGDFTINKTNFYGPWTLRHKGSVVDHFSMLQGAMERAAAIQARTA